MFYAFSLTVESKDFCFLVWDSWSLASEQAQGIASGRSFLQRTFKFTLSKQLPIVPTPQPPPLFSQGSDFEIEVL